LALGIVDEVDMDQFLLVNMVNILPQPQNTVERIHQH